MHQDSVHCTRLSRDLLGHCSEEDSTVCHESQLRATFNPLINFLMTTFFTTQDLCVYFWNSGELD
eukprot:4652708-Amphidinium_carterae.1